MTREVGWSLIILALAPPVLAQRLDALGDPLPPGAVARLGTARLRTGGTFEFHPDNNRILTGNHLWDENGKRIRTFPFGTWRDDRVSVSRQGDRIALFDLATGVGIFDIESPHPLHVLQFGRRGWVRTVDFSPAGDSLLLAHYEGPIALWKLGTACTQTWSREGKYQGAMFSPDGTWIAAWYGMSIERIDARTGEILSTLIHSEHVDVEDENRNEIEDIDISPNGASLASGGEDGAFMVWDIEKETPILRVEDAHRFSTYGFVRSVCFSPDNKTLATCGYDGIVRFWDLETKRQTHTMEQDKFQRVRFSPDGKRVALSGYGLQIRDAATGEPLIDPPGHGDRAQELKFIDGGKHLVSLGYNANDLCVWNPRTGEQLRRFRQPATHSMEILRDGPWAVVGGDRRLSLYHLLTGRRVALAESRDPQLKQYYGLSVSADGRRLVTSFGHTRSVIRPVGNRHTFDQTGSRSSGT